MFVFGHIGITVGIAKGCEMLTAPAIRDNQRWLSWLNNRVGGIDYRLVALGSLLPDIIDKPVWFIATNIMGGTALSGRDYTHTLLFNLVLIVGALVSLRHGKHWLLLLSLGSFTHLILDYLWQSPAVLLWPLLGPLAREETSGWLSGVFQSLFFQPEVYIPEIIGLLIITLLAYRLVERKGIAGFVRIGAID
ncbi:metal-dependent hydrolase [Chloroflexota bacterium]